jgi:hypothetical protein
VWWIFAVYELRRVTIRGGYNTVCVVLSAVISLPCFVFLGMVSPDSFVYVLVRVLLPCLVLMEVMSPYTE